MAHLQSRAMPQERDLREHGTTLSLYVKVGKAAVPDPDLQIRGGGGLVVSSRPSDKWGWCRPDLQIRVGGGVVQTFR